MENLSEKDIDYIFQEGSKRHEFPFKESSWDNMEVLLDRQDRRRRFGYASLAIFAMLLSSFLVYNFSNSEKHIKKEQSKSIEQIASKQINKPLEKTSTTKIQKTELADKINLKSSANALTNESISSSPSKKQTNNPALGSNSFSQKTNIQDIPVRVDEARLANEARLADEARTADESALSPSPNLELAIETEKTTTNSILNEFSPINNRAVLSNKLSNVTLLPTLSLNNVNYDNAEKNEFPLGDLNISQNLSRFRLGIILGSEWSGVGMNKNMKNGFRGGAELGFRLNNRFLLSSGVIFSRKKFKTKGENYFPESSWPGDVVPNIVNGTSNVFEVPLELTYFFSGSNRNSFYVSSGISTYIIDKEWHDFEFQESEHLLDPDIPKFANSQNIDTYVHYFGISTFSFGYHKRLSDNTSLQIAPYVQIPLTGIGIGRVELMTAGVQVKLLLRK